MARRPETQLFACPACAKLYKRKVDVWIDMRYPRAPSSPPSDIPRICVCSRVFLLSEATVVAHVNNRPSHRNRLHAQGMEESQIPAFLRKRTSDEAPPKPPGFFTRLMQRLRTRRDQPDPVEDVLRDMERIALPERMAPTPGPPTQ